MANKTTKHIFLKEQGTLLDRETAFISCIFDDQKLSKTKIVKNIFGFDKDVTEDVTKYYFKYGDKNWNATIGNFDFDELKEKWIIFAEEIRKGENNLQPLNRK